MSSSPALPNPRHLARLPAHIGPEALQRIRQAAYTLPQVVKPADYLPEGSTGFESHLDTLGLVLLQKSVPGQRPSRWIEPALMDAALAHLQAMDEAGAAAAPAGVRTLMTQRTAALEALGVTRRAGQWLRLASQALGLSEPAWAVTVLYRLPVPAEAVWAWYRSGDEAALRAALGTPAAWPHAVVLQRHLEGLLATSRAFKPKHMASLLPRLQAECRIPQPPGPPAGTPELQALALTELQAACTRAQERWALQTAELDTLDSLNTELAFQGYPGTFPKARRLQRRVRLFVGPPNSGKTHAAFERLAQALDGAYLAPLRLLALEGRDRLMARGVPCSLLTGEENQPAPDARVVSSTIEMVATNHEIDVAVIDEAQMVFDNSRGWAWTQAIVAVPARELIIICSAYAVPAIQNLLGLCGEGCEVQMFERKQHVQLLPRPVSVAALKHGDAVVAFSRRDVLQLRDRIAANTGKGGPPVSVIYGALPPEVRRREAERFATGDSHIVVATDAIGMGLNLPIRRVLFSTLVKFDGIADRPLDVSEVHQIAGRAGRYGMHDEGFAGVLEDAEPGALQALQDRLLRQPLAPRDFKAPVAPNGWHIATISARLGRTRLREVLDVFMQQLKLDDAHFAVAELSQMLELAAALDERAGTLTLKERFTYAQAPVDTRVGTALDEFLDWAAQHARTGRAGRPWFLDEVGSHSRLERMEQALRACTLWLWLDLRFENVFGHVAEVHALRDVLNDGIERQLRGQRPLAQKRMQRR